MHETSPVPGEPEIGVAFVGAGYTAREHIRAFKDCPGVKLAGIFSRTRARAEGLASEYGIATVSDSIAELYERTQAKLVVLTVNELAMNEVSAAAFAFPWVAFLEKPAGYNLADARAIQAAARARGRHVFVAMNRRSMSSTLAVLDDLSKETAPRFIKVQDQESQARALAGGAPQKVVDNWMFANAIHMIDYFHQLGRGRVVSVEPVLAWDPARPGAVVTKLGFESGDVGLYEGIWHGPGPWAVSVTIPNKRWELRPLEQAISQELGAPPATMPLHAWDTTFKPGFRLQAELAVAEARGHARRPARSLATLDQSVETMELIARIFQL